MNRHLMIGMFVAAGFGLFAFAIFLVGSQNTSFGKDIEFYTEFRNVDGLMRGAEVQVDGLGAGEVSEISVPASPSGKFRLKLRMNERIHELVRSDSVVTIATEGIVGDKFLLIHAGSANAPEATSGATLPSQEPIDMAKLLEESAGLLNNASSTIKGLTAKMDGTLDAVTATVNNANDLVLTLKQGRGTIGMLLRDQTTADDIRQAVSNVNQATRSLNHALGQADALVTDFHSRNFGQKADEVLANVEGTSRNINATSQTLQQTLATAFGPDAQGVDAGINIQQSLSNLNRASANMAEDTEAIKHGFFFRGFFRRRGYYSLAELEPDKYRYDKVFTNSEDSRVWIKASELFARGPDGDEIVTYRGKARIDAAVAELGDAIVDRPIVVEGYSSTGRPGEQLAVSRERANLIRDYLHTRFEIDLQTIGAVPLRGVPPSAVNRDEWDGACIVLLRPLKSHE